MFAGDGGAVLVTVGYGSLGDNGVVLCGLWVYQLCYCLICMVWVFCFNPYVLLKPGSLRAQVIFLLLTCVFKADLATQFLRVIVCWEMFLFGLLSVFS